MSVLDYITTASAGLPASLSPSDKVYKDDCMYSFDTPENNALGLDVCMTCFQAFSRATHHNYTQDHYAEKRHPLYVNITKELKPESERTKVRDDDERLSKQPKLEIVEQTETDIYNISSSIYVCPLNESWPIEEAPERARSLAELILKANSAEKNDEIKAWEQEVFTCRHSESIQVEKADANLFKCALCDLEENLWLCLTCGTVGCGRAQFGSNLKGESHALSHFESTGHAVAVKLGSLSAENEENCDCYCYLCNDEVKVPQLSSKLYQFGVDLTSAVKTEKSLIELNLDRNMNWQFNLEGANGEKLEPIFGPGLTGFQNLGNSCYLNSVLQALFSYSSYRRYFENLHFDKSVKDPAVNLSSQMIKIHDGLLSGRYSRPSALKGDEYQLGIKPSSFKALIGAEHLEFRTNKQQDANEFLLYLLDKLDGEFGLSLNKEFKFLMGNKVVCSECKAGSMTHELVDNVSIPLAEVLLGTDEDGKKQYKQVSLEESFSQLTSTEAIDHYKCESCGNVTTSLKTTGFLSYPENLIVNVQRIKLENWVPVKMDVSVEIPESINLAPFSAPKFSDGEVEVLKETSSSAFAPNEEAMVMLQSMGFSETRSIKGLFNTGNSSAEDAMNWVFAHMDDADIDLPFDPQSSNVEQTNEPLAELIDNLLAMGFSSQLAKKALVVNNNDMNAAVEWLFSNPDDDGVIENTKPVANVKAEALELTAALLSAPQTSTDYDLKAVVCHKGTSPHTGHYVVFVKNEGKWVLFNDEKVVLCDDNLSDIRNNGYIYFFTQTH